MVLLLGEKNESLLKLRLAVPLGHLRRHYVQKVIVVNGDHAFLVFVVLAALSVIGKLGDQTLDFLLCWLEAKGAKGDSQVLEGDVAVGVGVEKVESFLDVLLLLLSELLAKLTARLLAIRGTTC